MTKRLSQNFTACAAAGGLVLTVLVVVAAVGDQIRLAVVGMALLQLLVLGVVLVSARRSSATATAEQAATSAELARTITNVGLRSVDEIRSSERELGARIDGLEDLLGRSDRRP